MINQHTLGHLKKDLAFFNEYNQANYSNEIIFSIENLIARCQKSSSNEAILRIGSGSGFHSMTGDWQFDKYHELRTWNRSDIRKYGLTRNQQRDYIDKYQMFKSRRLAFLRSKQGYDFYPMGYVTLSLDKLEEEVVERYGKQSESGRAGHGSGSQVKNSGSKEAEQPAEEYKPTTLPAKTGKKGH
jgi:hypothetical protein